MLSHINVLKLDSINQSNQDRLTNIYETVFFYSSYEDITIFFNLAFQDAVVARQFKENPKLFKDTAMYWSHVHAGGK